MVDEGSVDRTWALDPDAGQVQRNAVAAVLAVANGDERGLCELVARMTESEARWGVVALATMAGAILCESPVAIERCRELALDYSLDAGSP